MHTISAIRNDIYFWWPERFLLVGSYHIRYSKLQYGPE